MLSAGPFPLHAFYQKNDFFFFWKRKTQKGINKRADVLRQFYTYGIIIFFFFKRETLPGLRTIAMHHQRTTVPFLFLAAIAGTLGMCVWLIFRVFADSCEKKRKYFVYIYI